ncbi:flagellar assembly protein FliH [Alteromonas aestuariivivens]|uniref:Flagellar assembly protein FliH n=1 Tax=Alteromonas aestuariivivens TaxID=1938339 RepID=A0A3D8M664_9ALTE|nr:flagellar assembly protein FliH [Alteromonas aestuariivivens]RDV25070.1 flagellar assembly protein FliH [Alteromonas aestuariivivens]
MNKPSRISQSDVDGLKAWDLPFMEDPQLRQNDGKTNALNRRSDWKYEPPEPEEEILPPTAEEIEAIRQAAYEEGVGEGKEHGYQQGLEQGLQEGREKGFEEGFLKGEQQGLEAGKAVVQQQAEVWQQLSDTLRNPLSQANEEARQQLVKLAVALARSVIRTEIQTHEQVILQALSDGLKALPINDKRYRIQMNPEDIELVTQHFGAQTVAEKGWDLVESPSMQRGGCDIVTEQNAVDVSIERRCREVLDKFLLQQGLKDD